MQLTVREELEAHGKPAPDQDSREKELLPGNVRTWGSLKTWNTTIIYTNGHLLHSYRRGLLHAIFANFVIAPHFLFNL